MGRTLIAGIVGGIVMFVWGAIAHTVLPLGQAGMKVGSEAAQTAVLDSVKQLDGAGIYLVPMMEVEKFEDEAAAQAFGARAAQSPYAFVVYHPQGQDLNAAFPKMLGTQLATTIVAGVVAAFLVGLMTLAPLQRALAIAGMGVFGWLSISVPHWNWYRFPPEFTLAALAEQAIGWFLAGLVIAFLLKNAPARG
jgi:hypothetical protein